MRIELLYFDGCPNHEAFLPRLRGLLDQAGVDEEIQLRRVESPKAAEREHFLGSPTLRVDGRDVEPGATERSDFGLKCRLYRSNAGLAGLPSDQWILDAIGGLAGNGSDASTEGKATGLSRSWAAQRLSTLTPAQRRLHGRVLRSFLGGATATKEQLAKWADEERLDAEEAYGALAACDLVHRDGSGEIAVAYPFSGQPTPHRVRLGSGHEVHAMCALDALGIAFMLDEPTEIASTDPATGEPVEVSVAPHGQSQWQPRQASVVVACEASGTSADCMCPHTNFIASTDHGHALLEEMDGSTILLSMSEAIDTGRDLFGDLLDDEPKTSDGQPHRA